MLSATSAMAEYLVEKPEFFDINQRIKISIRTPEDARPNMELLSKVWDARRPSQLTKLDKPLIPKIIHQVWIGSDPIPADQRAYIKECRELHPNWEYRLWTDKEVENFAFKEKDLYLKARNYQEKANILRMAVVREYGGIYIDTDVLCIKPYDELLDYYTFFVGLEPNYNPEGGNMPPPVINNALIASVPNHPIFKDFSEQIYLNWEKNYANYEKQSVNTFSVARVSLNNTFPQFTRSVLAYIKNWEDKRMVVFPKDYFYPVLSEYERDSVYDTNQYTFSVHDYIKGMRFIKFLPLEFDLPDAELVTRHYVLEQQYEKFKEYGYRPNHIAKTIHFVVNNSEDILSSWGNEAYNSWNIELWDDERLYNALEGKYVNLLENVADREAFELLGGIILIHKYGGVYINRHAKPSKESLFDLVYSLDFFAGIAAKNDKTFTGSARAIGSKPKHEITMRILELLSAKKEPLSLKDIQDVIWDKGYEYINIDGRNTFLPAAYFAPDDKNQYSILK